MYLSAFLKNKIIQHRLWRGTMSLHLYTYYSLIKNPAGKSAREYSAGLEQREESM